MKINKDDIKNVIENMFESFNQKEQKLYQNFIDSCEIETYDNYEEFYIGFIFPFENLTNSIVKNTISNNNDIIFIYNNSQFIENNFKYLIEKYEGFSCCSDKSRTILKSLIDFYANNNRIEFNYKGEYTFHLPKKIFTSHDDIVSFYEGLKNLRYGNPTKYLEILKIVTENLKCE
jgi:hypothetical protein